MSLKNAVGGVLLIAGTTIGAGVLALPVDTAHLGFNLTTLYFLVSWFFLTIGALYVLEANLQMGYGTNLISMAKQTLGAPGQVITWITYLLLLYALTAAYLTGAGAWIAKLFSLTQYPIDISAGAIITTLFLSAFLVLGTHAVDMINRVFMVILFSAFITLIVVGFPHINLDHLSTQHYIVDLKPIPLIITGFGFAIIVPSLTEYLHGNAKQLRNVILIGSLIPLVLYLIWEILILGVIPQEGSPSLLAMQLSGHPAVEVTEALTHITRHHWITNAAILFSVFALVTSILGVTLALFDFLADGLNLKKTIRSKMGLCLITFVPPLIFVSFYPEGFAHALRFAGIYVSIILGVLPALMVLKGRMIGTSPYRTFGGLPLILLTCLFFLGVIVIEILTLCHVPLIFFK